MKFFADDLFLPILRERRMSTVLEVGARYGDNTAMFLTIPHVDVTVIDPCIDHDLKSEFENRIEIKAGLSLDELPKLSKQFDSIFLDGDHNWFTLFNELCLIEKHMLLREDGIIFLHDVAWPYGRRDMYYQPEIIPQEYRQPYAAKGIKKGTSPLLDKGGFNSGHFNALREGGPRNGVLTAVQDFIKQSDREFRLVIDPRQFGLGILFRRTEINSLRFERQLRRQIFHTIHVAPKIQVWRRLVLEAKMSGCAKFLRGCRRRYFGK